MESKISVAISHTSILIYGLRNSIYSYLVGLMQFIFHYKRKELGGNKMGIVNNRYDVVIIYNRADAKEVDKIVRELQINGIKTWYDIDNAEPGQIWKENLYYSANRSSCFAVFFGSQGVGKWQKDEIALLDTICHENPLITNIPVILRGITEKDFPDHLKIYFAGKIRIEFSTNGAFKRLKDKIINEKERKKLVNPIEKKSFKIEVNVPAADQSCFLAMAKDCPEEIYTKITNVVGTLIKVPNSNIQQLKQTYKNGGTFVDRENIHNAIRSSELVIAVYCPNGESKDASSEAVIYEAGMAHALGKPTILITNKEIVKASSTLVFEEKPKFKIIEYREKNGIEKKLTAAIDQLTYNIKNPFLVDPDVKEIVAIPSDWLLFKDHFQAIIDFGMKTQEIRKAIAQSHVLVTRINEIEQILMIEAVNVKEHYREFIKNLRTLSTTYAEWNDEYSLKLENRKSFLKEKFDEIEELASDDTKEIFKKIKLFYNRILDDIADIPIQLKEVKLIENYSAEDFDNITKIRKVNACVNTCFKSMDSLYKNSEGMMIRLLLLMGKKQ